MLSLQPKEYPAVQNNNPQVGSREDRMYAGRDVVYNRPSAPNSAEPWIKNQLKHNKVEYQTYICFI